LLVSHAQGVAGEGINFLGNELVGVAIVGFPLPQFNEWNRAKSRFYSMRGVNGFKATFIFPAVSMTIQILGRLTRDLVRFRKTAVLIDDRFRAYRDYMPPWVRDNMVTMDLHRALKKRLWP
jgi:Rad3-related DNA helicase